jgi:hypothetical protein
MNVIAKDVKLPDEPAQTTSEPPVKPVMDVRPPQPETAANSAVHEAPPEPDDSEPEAKAAKAEKPPKPTKVVKPKQPRGNGVTAAIFASVVIILGLAALAVYAYLKSNNIPVS